MSLPESEKLRTKLYALTFRLREAAEDVARISELAAAAEKTLQDARFASLIGEESPENLPAKSAQTEVVLAQLAEETSLVQRLTQRRSETEDRYQKALRREWTSRLLHRWKEINGEGDQTMNHSVEGSGVQAAQAESDQG